MGTTVLIAKLMMDLQCKNRGNFLYRIFLIINRLESMLYYLMMFVL